MEKLDLLDPMSLIEINGPTAMNMYSTKYITSLLTEFLPG